MESKKPDRRVLRTRRMIKAAMMELLEEKPIDEISITALCERADINRNTFYCHYSSPVDVIRQMEAELTEKITKALSDSMVSGHATETVLAVLKEEQALTKLLFSDHAGRDFSKNILSVADSHMHTVAARRSSRLAPEYLAMLSDYVIAGATAVVRRWAEHGMRERPEDIAKFIRQLGSSGSDAVMNRPEPEFSGGEGS